MSVKAIIDRTNKRKYFILILIGIILVSLYLKIFYAEGAYFEGVFLKKEVK